MLRWVLVVLVVVAGLNVLVEVLELRQRARIFRRPRRQLGPNP